jgi:hypothetical protein
MVRASSTSFSRGDPILPTGNLATLCSPPHDDAVAATRHTDA